MKLLAALRMGHRCGLTTMGEAVDNVSIHAMSMFRYSDIDIEMLELEREAEGRDFNQNIVSLLGDKQCKEIDVEMAHDLA